MRFACARAGRTRRIPHGGNRRCPGRTVLACRGLPPDPMPCRSRTVSPIPSSPLRSTLRCACMAWICLLLTLAALPALAEPAPRPLPNLTFLASGDVQAVAIDGQGRILLGGDFTQADGVARSNLLRLNPDGSLDPDFDVPVNGGVRALAVADDGSIYLGGQFDVVGGVFRPQLARIAPSGEVDPDFPAANAGFTSVLALALDETAGTLFAAGLPAQVLKLSTSSGASDPDFTLSITAGAAQPVRRLQLDGLGGLYLAGAFTAVNGEARSGLARVFTNGTDGSAGLDTGFVPALPVPVAFGGIFALQLTESALFVGGAISAVRSNLVKLDPASGALDTGWRPDPNAAVTALAQAPDGSLIAAGDFTRVAGIARRGLVRLSPAGDGLLDPDWTPTLHSRASGLLVDGDRLYLWGFAREVEGASRTAFAALGLDAPATLVDGMDVRLTLPGGTVYANQAMPDGSLWIGGQFRAVDGAPRENLARILPDGSVDPETDIPVAGIVYDLAADAAGRVYAAGEITRAGDAPRDALFRIAADHQLDAGFLAGVRLQGFPGRLYEIDLSTSALYVAGAFDAAGEVGGSAVARTHVAKFELDSGVVVDGWAPDLSGNSSNVPVQSLDVDEANDWLYIGGGFQYLGGVPHLRIGRVSAATGAPDHGFNPAADDGEVWALGVDGASGHLFVGGTYSTFNATPGQHGIVRLSTETGAIDPGFQPGLSPGNTVESIFFDSDESVCLGGFLQGLGGVTRLLRASGERDLRFDPQVQGYVANMSLRPTDRSLVVSGLFTLVGVDAREHVAALQIGDALFVDGFE